MDVSTAIATVTDMVNGLIGRLPLIVIALGVLAIFYIAAPFLRFGVRRVVGDNRKQRPRTIQSRTITSGRCSLGQAKGSEGPIIAA